MKVPITTNSLWSLQQQEKKSFELGMSKLIIEEWRDSEKKKDEKGNDELVIYGGKI